MRTFATRTRRSTTLFCPDYPSSPHAGATLASQLAGSQLHAIGMPESATSNTADSEALARHLAHNGERATPRARRREQ